MYQNRTKKEKKLKDLKEIKKNRNNHKTPHLLVVIAIFNLVTIAAYFQWSWNFNIFRDFCADDWAISLHSQTWQREQIFRFFNYQSFWYMLDVLRKISFHCTPDDFVRNEISKFMKMLLFFLMIYVFSCFVA